LQEAFPGNVVSNHLVNANPVSEAFLNLSKPFLNKELARKVSVLRKLSKHKRLKKKRRDDVNGFHLAHHREEC
jgi:hypothetical protein